MAISLFKLATIAAVALLTQAPSALAAPSPVETFTPVAAGSEPAPTPLSLPTGGGDVHVIDGEVVNSTDHRLLARQNEPGLRLLNCDPIEAGGPGAPAGFKWTSIVVYCENMGQCNNPAHVPSGNDVCVKKQSSVANDFYIWEGGPKSCTFPTGVTFTWNIPSNAQSQADYSFVGTGSNGFRSFNGFKDNKQQAVNWPALVQRCYKIYWYQ